MSKYGSAPSDTFADATAMQAWHSLATRQALSAFAVGQLNACARLEARRSHSVFGLLRDGRQVSLVFVHALDEKQTYARSAES